MTAATCKAVEIFLEADFQMYTDWGNSVPFVVNQMTSIFNNVVTLYDNEGVNLLLSNIFAWTVSDPYSSASNSSESLN